MNVFQKIISSMNRSQRVESDADKKKAFAEPQEPEPVKSPTQSSLAKEGREIAETRIWQHAIENIQNASQDKPGPSQNLLTSPPLDVELLFQKLWLTKLKETPDKKPKDLLIVHSYDLQKSTNRLLVRLSYFMESLVDQFNKLNLDEESPITISFNKPLLVEEVPSGKGETFSRFRISTPQWSISIRGKEGHIEFFLVPSTEILALAKGESEERLKLKMELMQKSGDIDLWGSNGLPIDTEELKILLRNLFKDLVVRTAVDRSFGADNVMENLNGQALTDYFKSLVLEKGNLAQKIVMQQEEIQNRISRDLHDAVISDVMMLKRSLVGEPDMGKTQIISILDQITQRLREICHDLAPRDLKDWGLQTVIEDLLQNLAERTGADCQLSCACEIPDLPNAVQLHIFRIIQEALNNIEKYAHASQVKVFIDLTNNRLNFSVLDNGRGFERGDTKAKSHSEGGAGISGMRERTELISCFYPAKVSIDSTPGQGSVLQLEIALRADFGQD